MSHSNPKPTKGLYLVLHLPLGLELPQPSDHLPTGYEPQSHTKTNIIKTLGKNLTTCRQVVRLNLATAAERGENNLKGFKDFRTEKKLKPKPESGTVLCVPSSLYSGRIKAHDSFQGHES